MSAHKNQSKFEIRLIEKQYFEILIDLKKNTFQLGSSLQGQNFFCPSLH